MARISIQKNIREPKYLGFSDLFETKATKNIC